MASTESIDIVAEFDAQLFQAGSIWDVRDRERGAKRRCSLHRMCP
ncbi:hypothetical protein [Methylobacterium nodulans]|uniref:Uncharacterized protein n=1 Tax=Methylobacterium nodulans (strain LMG 21967 / CNCM I-2342 / ORS 2060) TaxID=460265 RepID=B8II84_METNO|nr:hypothetical protein [Methylobacterium nodulans]ACL57953.1 hypothetical protein Mnod_3010 [Methylobacterium nodulans ORS 2060]